MLSGALDHRRDAIFGAQLEDWPQTSAISGERLTVIAHTPEELVLEDVWPAGHDVPEHRHPVMSEHWRVCEGLVAITIEGRERTLRAGREIEAAAGLAHSGRNLGDAPARLRMTLRPAARWLQVVERLFRGDEVAELLREYADELAVTALSEGRLPAD